MNLPSPTLSAVIASGAPRIEPKWTIVNDEWVQVLCEIQRGPKGLSDRPAALSAMAQIGVVP